METLQGGSSPREAAMDAMIGKLLEERKPAELVVAEPRAMVVDCGAAHETSASSVRAGDGRLVVRGIFTERDVLTRVWRSSAIPATTRVEEVMTRELASVTPQATVREGMQLMTTGASATCR